GDGGVDAIVGTADAVEQERGRRNRADGFLEVVATRISDDHSRAGLWIGLEAMVDADRGGGSEAREQRLHARAESGEVVRADAAGRNHEVGFEQTAMDAHGSTARRGTELDEVGIAVPIVVDDRGVAERGR